MGDLTWGGISKVEGGFQILNFYFKDLHTYCPQTNILTIPDLTKQKKRTEGQDSDYEASSDDNSSD